MMLFTTDADKSHKRVMLTGRPGRFGSAPGLLVGIMFCLTQSITLTAVPTTMKSQCSTSDVNPFSPTLLLTVAKMIYQMHSVPYWSNTSYLIFWYSGTLVLRTKHQSAGISKNYKGWVRTVWRWTLWSVTIWHRWAWKG